MDSDVYALDLHTGKRVWAHLFHRHDGGPNGLAFASGAIFGNTDTAAFALDARTGTERWRRQLTTKGQPIDIAPVAANGLVYTSTTGLPPGGKGTVYALDQRSGAVRWRFVTVRDPWAMPSEAGGGGLWWPVSVDAAGRVYAGTSNPLPWGGTKEHPNGGAYRGSALYTDSLLVLDGSSGRLLWFDQVTPHDVRDYDFAVTPILATLPGRDLAIGAGKGGVVIAWDRATHRRIWSAPVGLHLNDRGPLPRRDVTVCPGLLGGVVTPMAYAGGRVFAPVVDLCMRGSSSGYPRFLSIPYASGRGELVALDARDGRRLWRRRFGSPDFGCATVSGDVVFTSTYNGGVYGLATASGRLLWQARARAGINACPTVAGTLLLVPAGADPTGLELPTHELVAYGLPR
jgi:outer membrane protein assembly factor BamB